MKPEKAVRFSLIAVSAVLVLLGCAAQPHQQLAADPPGPAPVCAVKSGDRQSYWSAQAAQRDGAFVILTRECPARPNSEGGGGGSGGM